MSDPTPVAPPKPAAQPDWSDLIKTITDGVAMTALRGFVDKNFEGYVAEAALGTLYGSAYWKWVDELRRQQRRGHLERELAEL